jgi:hypothetical protein
MFWVEKSVPLHQSVYIGSDINIHIRVADFLVAFVEISIILCSFLGAEDPALNVILRENVTILYDPPVDYVALVGVGQRRLTLESGFEKPHRHRESVFVPYWTFFFVLFVEQWKPFVVLE